MEKQEDFLRTITNIVAGCTGATVSHEDDIAKFQDHMATAGQQVGVMLLQIGMCFVLTRCASVDLKGCMSVFFMHA